MVLTHGSCRAKRLRRKQQIQLYMCIVLLLLWFLFIFFNDYWVWFRRLESNSTQPSPHSDDNPSRPLGESALSSLPMVERFRNADQLKDLPGRKSVRFSPVGIARAELLAKANAMVDLKVERNVNRTLCPTDPHEHERPVLLEFLKFFTQIFRDKFDNLPWIIDEGGLIGIGRAGSISDADDDFDFFVVLPNSTAPCRPDSLDCTKDEFNTFIHGFLMHFWNAGACINRFNPDLAKFHSNGRLMYSFQLNRKFGVNPQKCFNHRAPFAHMHLGMLNADGELETNKYMDRRSRHGKDKIPLDLILPVRRCRMGPLDAPCPNSLVKFLTNRNAGEYVRRSNQGQCLLVRKRWSMERKRAQVEKVQLLHRCGYNSMIELVEPLVKSDYAYC